MPFEPYTIDETIISTPSGTARVRVPEGGYLLEILDCLPSAEKDNTAHLWQIKILQGAGGIGGTLSYYAGMKDSNPNLGKKSTFFKDGNVIGSALSPESADAFQRALAPDETGKPRIAIRTYADHVKFAQKLGEKLRGKTIYGLVGDTESGGKVYSNVVEVGPPSMYSGPTAAPAVEKPATPPKDGTPITPATPANSVQPDAQLTANVDNIFAGLKTV